MKLKTLTLAASAGIALAGCATPVTVSGFEPYDATDGKAMFKYYSYIGNPDDPGDEKERIAMLDLWLKKSNYCPNGYKITSRKVAWGGAALDSSKKIYYVGTCN